SRCCNSQPDFFGVCVFALAGQFVWLTFCRSAAQTPHIRLARSMLIKKTHTHTHSHSFFLCTGAVDAVCIVLTCWESLRAMYRQLRVHALVRCRRAHTCVLNVCVRVRRDR
ncbi:unnamed protein product, partial [Ectocarpus sp. 13 AM-2016]